MDFKFPDVGEGITEGKLVAWRVNVGDYVKSEQTVASIETDKAVVDIPSPVSGTVESLPYENGDVVFVGKTLMTINDGNKNSNITKLKEEVKVEKKIEQSTPINNNQPITQSNNFSFSRDTNNSSNFGSESKILAMPAVRKAARMKGINLSNIHGSGSHGQILLSDINLKLSDITGIQSVEYNYSTAKQTNSSYTNIPINLTSSSNSFNNKSYSDILATLATKQLARTLGIDLTQVKGTGTNGMITADDVRNYATNKTSTTTISVKKFESIIASNTSQTNQFSPSSISTSKIVGYGDGSVTNIPFNSIRNAIYKHMTESKNMIAQFTLTDEVDVTELYTFREKYKEHYEKQGIKITYLPFIVRAVVDGLTKHPHINSSVNDGAKELVIKKFYNIGIATDTPDGLVVPVIKDADKKNIIQVASEINTLSAKARDHKLSLEDIKNGTFTITSLGNNFGQVFTPIINYPETAILGVGRIVEKPVVVNGIIVPRKMITLSLSCDHRVIDGAVASRFMNDIKWNIENFETLLL